MKRLFSKIYVSVLVTILILVALGAIYVFAYLPRNEATLQERRFRALQVADAKITKKNEQFNKEISDLIYYYDTVKNKKGTEETAADKYAESREKNLITLVPPDRARKYFSANTNLIYTGDDTSTNLKYYLDVSSHLTFLGRKLKTPRAGEKGKPNTIEVGIRFDFKPFIDPVLPSDVFDQYVVFINKKKIYQTYQSGLDYEDVDSLLAVKSPILTPGVRSIKIGGTDYKVFSHTAYIDSQNKWIICGLLKDTDYQQEKTQLPLWVSVLLLTSATIVLILLPWIKLYNMGSSDRLDTADAAASLITAMILISVLSFAFFKYHLDFNRSYLTYKRVDKPSYRFPEETYSVNVLADKVLDSFQKETDRAYVLLNNMDRVHQPSDANLSNLGKKPPKPDVKSHRRKAGIKDNDRRARMAVPKKAKERLITKYDQVYNKYCGTLGVGQVYWMDKDGWVTTDLTTSEVVDPKANYSVRAYFKYGLAKTYERAVGDSGYYIDQIYSYTEGIFRTVISKHSSHVKDGGVVAMTVTLQNFNKVVMPEGYQFAIISNQGWVLYHSKPDRNLFETLKEEFTDNRRLTASIEARADTTFQASYYGKAYTVKVKPFRILPHYYVVIMEDNEFNNTRDKDAYTFTLFMLLCISGIALLKYLVIIGFSVKKTLLKNQQYDYSWAMPRRSLHHHYNCAAVGNVLTIIAMLFFFNSCCFLLYLYIIVISIFFTSLLYNGILVVHYHRKYQEGFILRRWICLALGLFVIAINFSAYYRLPDDFPTLLGYEGLLIAIYCITAAIGKYIFPFVRKMKGRTQMRWRFTHSYTMMVVTRLMILNAIPVAFFFIYSYNYEQNLNIRYQQFEYAKALKQRYGKQISDSISLTKLQGSYTDGVIVKTIQISAKDTGKNFDSVPEDSLTAAILGELRGARNTIATKLDMLDMMRADSLAKFSHLNRRIKDTLPIETKYNYAPGKYMVLSSMGRENYHNLGVIFWTLVILALVVFFKGVHWVVKKVFAVNVFKTDRWARLDTGLLTNNGLNDYLLIVGTPGSDTLLKLTSNINSGMIKGCGDQRLLFDSTSPLDDKVFVADMMKISAENGEFDKVWSAHKQEALRGYAMVIINHFEYNIANAKANKIKLDLLETLLEQQNSKIIIVSSLHPLIFLNSLNTGPESEMLQSDIERWHSLLGSFRAVIDPLTDFRDKPRDPAEDILVSETDHGRFLLRMRNLFISERNDLVNPLSADEYTEESVIDSGLFKLQLTSQYYYMSIWRSLTREEKFILYDLAEDGLVNTFDSFNVSILISKGLIVRDDGVLILFNKSFRNFILTAIGEAEITTIKKQIKDNGKWGSLKIPLGLATVAVLLFLFFSQQEAYSKAVGYITAFGAGIPAVIRLFSMFSGNRAAPKAE